MIEASSNSQASELSPVDSRFIAIEEAPRRRILLILTLLTLAGAWLRLWRLGAQSLWLDEGATVALARASWRHFVWVWWHGEANLQTIYFLLMRGWVHGGLSESWLRLPSALFGIASIPLLYLVARKFIGASASLAAAALLAFSPAHVYFSQEARGYALAILLALVSTYCFVSAVERNRAHDWAWWTIAGIAAFYTHDFAALVLVAQAVSLLFLRGFAAWRRFLLCGSLIFVAAIPGLTYVFRASPENLHFVWMPRASPREFWHLALFLGGGGVKIAIALGLWIAGIVAIFRNRRSAEPDSFWRGMLVLSWALVPATILALISLHEPIFLDRYMVFSLPATLLLAAIGADVLEKWKIGWILVIALCALSLPTIAKQSRKPREDWRGAANTILASAAPGDAVVFFPFYTRIMLDYYGDRYGASAPSLHVFAPAYYSGGEDARDLLAALNRDPHQFRHVWMVVADHGAGLQNFDQSDAMGKKLSAILGEAVIYKFTEVDVLEYGGASVGGR